MADGQWYWCLDHHAVEPYRGCKSDTRLGPYASAEEASHALDQAQARNEAWDTDPKWNDPEEDEDGDGEPDERTGWGPFKF